MVSCIRSVGWLQEVCGLRQLICYVVALLVLHGATAVFNVFFSGMPLYPGDPDAVSALG